MYFIDDDFLAALKRPDAPIRDVYVPAGEPFFDIAVLADAFLDDPSEDAVNDLVRTYDGHLEALSEGQPPQLLVSAGDLVQVTDISQRDALLAASVDAFVRMGRGGTSALFSVPGNHDLVGGVQGYYESFASAITEQVAGGSAVRPSAALPVAAVFRVRLDDPASDGMGLPDLPMAHIAVIGFDSNAADEGAHDYGQVLPAQLDAFRSLVATLRTDVSACAPLYVIAVTHHNLLPVEDRLLDSLTGFEDPEKRVAFNVRNTSANASGLLEQCRRLRTALLVHAHMHQRDVLDIVSTPLDPRRVGADLTIMSAPTFERGRPVSGMARIRLDLHQGLVELAVDYDRGPDGEPGVPVQTTRKLTSASRISAAERKLYDAASAVIGKAMRSPNADWREHARSYRDYVTEIWQLDGCVPLGLAGSQLPQLTATERQGRYNVLLLLRERAGRYEILLSRHTPLKPSEVGGWDTLLMPAFTDARALLEHLHDDVMRQVAARSTDLAKAASGREFVTAVREILATTEPGGTLWSEEFRDLAVLDSRKLSPTTGQVTATEFHLIVLLPFVQEIRPSGAERERNNYRTVVNWLNELPSVKLPGEPLTGPGSIPIESLYRGGAGLRWEPSADPDHDANETQVRKGHPLPPGALWFPLPESDETDSAWVRCPMIEHRNLDVLTWVKGEIDKRRDIQGRYLPHLLLGGFRGDTGFVAEPDGLLPFEAPTNEAPTNEAPTNEAPTESAAGRTGPANSTVEALRRITYWEGSDLGRDSRPYAGMDYRRVALQRRPLERKHGRKPLDVIMVFDATEFADAHSLAGVQDLDAQARLGILRPVQRYVMRAGLDRAKTVNGFRQWLVENEEHDPWGFVRARFGEFGETLALTPPILEQISFDETQFDPSPPLAPNDHREFVLCDGNHRVVQTVWIERETLAGVAVLGSLPEPYYAFPFSAYEWNITASQIVNIAPPTAAKYAARRPPSGSPDEKNPNWYRRYYRDLSAGFGNVGAQGGRA